MSYPGPPDVEDLIASAWAHGDQSEPDHEIGDLQEILRSCWRIMTRAERERLIVEQQELLDTWRDK